MLLATDIVGSCSVYPPLCLNHLLCQSSKTAGIKVPRVPWQSETSYKTEEHTLSFVLNSHQN